MSKNYIRIVPWRDLQEFRSVYELLYSSEVQDNLKGLELVKTWNQESYMKAVELTMDLVHAVVRRQINQENVIVAPIVFQIDSKMNLAIALTRFVNLLSGEKATRLSIIQRAEKHGIPDWIVDIRHDVSHNKLPSLDFMLHGARWALRYLEKKFWLATLENLRPLTKMVSNVQPNNVHQYIDKYRKNQFKRIRSIKKNQDLIDDQKLTLFQLGKALLKDRRKFLKTLCEPGVFVSQEDLAFLEENDFSIRERPDLPELALKIWAQLIALLLRERAFGDFICRLMRETPDFPEKLRPLVAAWGMATIRADVECRRRREPGSLLAEKFSLFKFSLDLNEFLMACVRGWNKCTLTLVNVIVKSMDPKNQQAAEFLKLLVATSSLSPRESSSRKLSYDEESWGITQDDVIQQIELSVLPCAGVKKSIWKRPSADINWSDICIGHVFNPVTIEKKMPDTLEEEEDDVCKIVSVEQVDDDDDDDVMEIEELEDEIEHPPAPNDVLCNLTRSSVLEALSLIDDLLVED